MTEVIRSETNSPTNSAPINIPKDTGPATEVPCPIGGPPDTMIPQSNVLMQNSNLQIEITPCDPEFNLDGGIQLFICKPNMGDYKKVLSEHGFQLSAEHGDCVTLNVQSESLPSDTFTNDYGESFLNQMLDVGGAAFGEIAQIFNAKTATEGMGKFGKGIQGGSGVMGSIGNYLGGAMEEGAKKTDQWIKDKKGEKSILGTMAGAANELLAGSRVDFPNIWKNSSYSPTFSCTCRLYNPSPGDDDATKKYIIAPLAAILALGLPRMKDSDSFGYQWPFMCKVKCKGVFEIKAGAIQNITVVKGGDAQSIAYNQRLGIIDVRLDFINLHGVLVTTPATSVIENRPTLKGYLDNLFDSYELEKIDKGDGSLARGILTAISAAQFIGNAIESNAGSSSIPRVPADKIAKEAALKILKPF